MNPKRIKMNIKDNKISVDVAQVQKITTKAKNPYRCSKFPLNKKFKLILEQNVENKQILK